MPKTQKRPCKTGPDPYQVVLSINPYSIGLMSLSHRELIIAKTPFHTCHPCFFFLPKNLDPQKISKNSVQQTYMACVELIFPPPKPNKTATKICQHIPTPLHFKKVTPQKWFKFTTAPTKNQFEVSLPLVSPMKPPPQKNKKHTVFLKNHSYRILAHRTSNDKRLGCIIITF